LVWPFWFDKSVSESQPRRWIKIIYWFICSWFWL